jgi:hypothetical protein
LLETFLFNKDEMIVLDVFYIALATIVVMLVLQVSTFLVPRMLYPPEPKIIYRDVPMQMPHPPPQMQAQIYIPPVIQPQQNGPVLTQPPPQEVNLPEYEPRKPASDSLRLDTELPAGLKETRPDGT